MRMYGFYNGRWQTGVFWRARGWAPKVTSLNKKCIKFCLKNVCPHATNVKLMFRVLLAFERLITEFDGTGGIFIWSFYADKTYSILLKLCARFDGLPSLLTLLWYYLNSGYLPISRLAG